MNLNNMRRLVARGCYESISLHWKDLIMVAIASREDNTKVSIYQRTPLATVLRNKAVRSQLPVKAIARVITNLRAAGKGSLSR